MSSVVCQGLQSISFLEPWPKVSATRPYCARSLSCARKARIFDSDSEKFQQEKNSNNEELESNNNCSDFDRDKNKKNQFCSNGSDMGGWSCIQALVNTSQDPKPAVAAKEKDEKEKLYIHPLVKRTSSQLSEKSLEMCTENLGSETGSDISEEEIIINSSNYDRVKERSKSSLPQLSKVNSREFPPPLISDASRDLDLFKIENKENVSTTHCEVGESTHPMIARKSETDYQASESVPTYGSVPLDDHKDSFTRRSTRGHAPRCHFEIEGETLICVLKDEYELASLRDTLSSPTKDKWQAAIEDELSSMSKNQI
ncbi:uncharacterized protein LOC122092404 [Macadamia integrifolia]|uniref:uncharacterized protein LOC122092404 n=1 Tax=Macadamia integrifolia TaxID=60698 RepID=UPI001C52E538|nr:uncharacterized protein LOC122092404 [Macadamia integrifolia]